MAKSLTDFDRGKRSFQCLNALYAQVGRDVGRVALQQIERAWFGTHEPQRHDAEQTGKPALVRR